MRGLSKNRSDLTIASSQYDILLCSETLVFDVRSISELLVTGLCHHVLLCHDRISRAQGLATYVRDGYGSFVNPSSSVVVTKYLYL